MDDLVDAERSGGFEDLEGAADIQVKEIVCISLAAILVDSVPGGDMNNAIATTKCFRQLRPVENRSLGKHRSRLQISWCPNIQNDGRITPVEQPGDEGLAEISRPSCQKHLHCHLRHLALVARQYPCTLERSAGIEQENLAHCTLTERGGTEWPAAARPQSHVFRMRIRVAAQ